MTIVESIRRTVVSPRATGDLAACALNLGVEQDALAAFIEVEAAGKGYNGDGSVKLLFEKHRFYKNLSLSLRGAAVDAGLARRNWVKPSAGGYDDQKSTAARWDILARAAKLDVDAALSSTSWGAGQVMGEHWRMLGYASPENFVGAMALSEAEQFEAMARYIKAAGLRDEIQEHDWAGCAKGYNGAGQVAIYAPRLARAYARLRGLPDDPLPSGTPPLPEVVAKAVVLHRGLKEPEAVRELQVALQRNGAGMLAIDGDFGPATEAAVKAFQSAHQLKPDGIVGAQTRTALGLAL